MIPSSTICRPVAKTLRPSKLMLFSSSKSRCSKLDLSRGSSSGISIGEGECRSGALFI